MGLAVYRPLSTTDKREQAGWLAGWTRAPPRTQGLARGRITARPVNSHLRRQMCGGILCQVCELVRRFTGCRVLPDVTRFWINDLFNTSNTLQSLRQPRLVLRRQELHLP
jgi:hypothetical protein